MLPVDELKSRSSRHADCSNRPNGLPDAETTQELLQHRTTRHRRLLVRVHSVSGELLYQHCPPSDGTLHWAYIMSHILAQSHGPAPCQITLVGDIAADRCFAAGNSFSSLYWFDMEIWQSLLAQIRALTHPSLPHLESSQIIEIIAVFSPCLAVGDIVYGGHTFGHWIVSGIVSAGLGGYSFSLIHSTTHMQRTCRSRAFRAWRNEGGIELGTVACLELTRSMPFSRGRACLGCARLLLPLGVPDRYETVRLTAFPADTSECECQARGRSLTVQSMPFSQFQ